MKTGSWAKKTVLAVALVAAAAIPGCSGFWDPPPSTGSGSGSSGNNPASGVFYVINQRTMQIAGYSFAASTTTPTAVSGSPYTLAAVPYSLAIDPTGSFLYVGTAAGIYVYTIGSGALTIANSGQPISTDPAYAMQVDSTGGWLVEAASGAGVLNAVAISSSTGLLDTSRGTDGIASVALTSASSVNGIALSPSGSSSPYAFVAMGTGGTAIIPFTASSKTSPFGSVSTIKVKNSPGGDNAVAVDPSNRLLYVGETVALSSTQSGGLRVFPITSSGTGAEISGSPYSTGGTGPSSILATATAVYISNSAVSGKSSGNISGFTVAGSGTYTLTAINTISAGAQTSGIAEDGTGAYLLAVNYGGNPDLSAFTFDSTTTGQLDSGPTSTTGTDPVGAWAIVAVPGSGASASSEPSDRNSVSKRNTLRAALEH